MSVRNVQPNALEAALSNMPNLTNMSNGPAMLVLGTGLEVVGGHYEYTFLISHRGGCSWKVQRRYRDLLALHDSLFAHGVKTLPPFPPKHSIAQRFQTSERDVATKRIVELQRYLQVLVTRRETAAFPLVQKMLGVEIPEAPSGARVASWEHIPGISDFADVELEVRAAAQVDGSCCPVEVHQVEVNVLPRLSGLTTCEAKVDGKTFSASIGAPVRVTGLPCGTEVEFALCSRNAVGKSGTISIRCAVPEQNKGTGLQQLDTVSTEGSIDGFSPGRPLSPLLPINVTAGSRVLAVWAGDGHWYDAVVRRVHADNMLTVDWLRPAPLSSEELCCVCEAGGDDTSHRRLPVKHVRFRGRYGPGL
mmetsp:Transcript_104539/g.181544  ORF Transcript_104539/g.181544 Transcript_104539/m.181544 type:complete len:362 (+) Transcript_104539:126-1211(+)